MTVNAFCWRSGLVEFGVVIPKGARLLACNLDAERRATFETKCRLAYDGRTLLVPGVPEAASAFDAEKAVDRFIKWAVEGKKLSLREVAQSRTALRRSLRALKRKGPGR
ncbi:MAG: host nuclease inhibitor protein [Rhizobiales bacterium]|nr:host nuclease inhibitor protein [Hyphomicrobiales bacterium]